MSVTPTPPSPYPVPPTPPVPPSVIKPGYTTTEFWLTIGSTVASFIVALFALFHKSLTLDPDARAFIVAAAPVAAMIGTGFYTWSRSRTKTAVALATANLHSASIEAQGLAVAATAEANRLALDTERLAFDREALDRVNPPDARAPRAPKTSA